MLLVMANHSEYDQATHYVIQTAIHVAGFLKHISTSVYHAAVSIKAIPFLCII